MKGILGVFLAVALGLSWPCLWAQEGPVEVYVSLPPMAEAVEAIGGKEVSVGVLLPAGSNPETYQPDARSVAALGRSQALFLIGAPFEEALLPRLRRAFPRLSLVNGAEGMRCRNFPEGGDDPHVWLSVSNMLLYADNVCRALCALRPGQEAQFRRRLADYRASLEKAGREIRALLAPLEGRSVLVYHPAFGFFLDECGIGQIAIEEEGKEPSGRTLTQALSRARELALPAIFVQPQFSPRSAKALARELGCRVIPLDPLPSRLTEGLKAMAAAIAEAYCPAGEARP